jgi:4-amino-4-deoxy-L-arabinose transferase-like glycosyltransferase
MGPHQPNRGFWLAGLSLGGLALLHLAVGAATGLSVDEAHYALYALHPALSYFDHPPLVGWVQVPLAWASVALGGWLGDAGPWRDGLLLRLVPVAAWVFAVLLLQAAARTLGMAADARRWLWALVLAAPLWHVIGFGLVPDTLLLPLASALMAWLWRMREPDVAAQWTAWLVLGGLLGLAGLTKYTAVLLVPGVLWVLWRAHGWAPLRNPGAWLGLGLAFALISPVLLWNAQNGWVSFAYQADHGGGSTAWHGRAFLSALLLQALVYGPALVGGVLAAWWGWRRADVHTRQVVGFCTALALPTLALLLALSGRGGSLPHWTSVAWWLLAPVGAMALAGMTGLLRQLWRAAVALQLLASVALLLAVGLGLRVGGADGAGNPFADFHGWRDAVAQAVTQAKQRQVPLAVQNWTLGSRAAWYAHPVPVTVLDTRQDQFDRWFGGPVAGQGAVLLGWSGLPFEVPVRTAANPNGFAACERLGGLVVRRLGSGELPLARFEWHACTDWQGTAAPQRKGRG